MPYHCNLGDCANYEKIRKYRQKLKSASNEESIKHTNNFYFLGYNPPFDFFNRKNELIVELQN